MQSGKNRNERFDLWKFIYRTSLFFFDEFVFFEAY